MGEGEYKEILLKELVRQGEALHLILEQMQGREKMGKAPSQNEEILIRLVNEISSINESTQIQRDNINKLLIEMTQINDKLENIKSTKEYQPSETAKQPFSFLNGFNLEKLLKMAKIAGDLYELNKNNENE
ncbi:hypothetical protein [Cytobacillus massiliigabonensis]|uniref:hypothetical protein n=1 Tax=Cytobacillus massiliigabonensis TaxID=1871011 RepID=UPI000C825823|nr:hypothetical protein [Cytobacillus massiliigabonensis]